MNLITQNQPILAVTVAAAIITVLLIVALVRQLLQSHLRAAAATTGAIVMLTGITWVAATCAAAIPVSAALPS